MSNWWFWLTLLGLGAYHGINPAMGWLFAVALGMQEKSRRAVMAAILPIALGHALAIGAVVSLLWLAQKNLPMLAMRYGAAAIIFGFGFYRLVRSRHPKWVGMRVGFRDLTLWSFIMASAHGAGLMLAPIILARSGVSHNGDHLSHPGHMDQLSPQQPDAFDDPWRWLAAIGAHSLGFLLAVAMIAIMVYEKFGLRLLNRAWFNIDWLWVIALMVSGVLILFI
ncbi:MAG TPA: hypothetical protein VJZ77_05650 [Blastocatellia bacterium]|nr:hypothetical protein [Blastocatellia bacterium]